MVRGPHGIRAAFARSCLEQENLIFKKRAAEVRSETRSTVEVSEHEGVGGGAARAGIAGGACARG
jgi:hypothetical protein